MKTVYELNRAELTELKEQYLTNYLLEVENRTPSTMEIVIVDTLIDDGTIHENYEGMLFEEEDFFCNIK